VPGRRCIDEEKPELLGSHLADDRSTTTRCAAREREPEPRFGGLKSPKPALIFVPNQMLVPCCISCIEEGNHGESYQTSRCDQEQPFRDA
jgi:hypothetical protein